MADESRSLPFPLDIDTLHSLKAGGFILFGTTMLVSGTVTVADRRIQPSSTVIASYRTPAGTTGANLKGVCSAGAITLTAINTSGATVTTDTSKVSYFIVL